MFDVANECDRASKRHWFNHLVIASQVDVAMLGNTVKDSFASRTKILKRRNTEVDFVSLFRFKIKKLLLVDPLIRKVSLRTNDVVELGKNDKGALSRPK